MASDEIWKTFPGCKCLKSILITCGFDIIASLRCINDEKLKIVEEYVEENRWIIEEMTCKHLESYDKPTKFQFLPGHRAIILDWCQNEVTSRDETSHFTVKDAAFTPILSEIIANALSNHQKPPNLHRFSKMIMDFSIYIYIMAGRACYEILCANLSLPKSGTVGKAFRLILVSFL